MGHFFSLPSTAGDYGNYGRYGSYGTYRRSLENADIAARVDHPIIGFPIDVPHVSTSLGNEDTTDALELPSHPNFDPNADLHILFPGINWSPDDSAEFLVALQNQCCGRDEVCRYGRVKCDPVCQHYKDKIKETRPQQDDYNEVVDGYVKNCFLRDLNPPPVVEPGFQEFPGRFGRLKHPRGNQQNPEEES